MAYKLNVDGEDRFLFSLEEALYGGKVKNTIRCKKCLNLYKAEGQTFVWEFNPSYEGLCRDCYIKELNENFTEEDAKKVAEDALAHSFLGEPRRDNDINDKNWDEKVVPEIDRLIKEKREQKEKEYHDRKLKEAQDLYNAASCGTVSDEMIIIKVIAALLERIENLENNQSEKRLTDGLFC